MAALPLATAELCDSNADQILSGGLRALQPIFRAYGRRHTLRGPRGDAQALRGQRAAPGAPGAEGPRPGAGGGRRREHALRRHGRQPGAEQRLGGARHQRLRPRPDEINGCDVGVRALTRILDGECLYAGADGILLSGSELTI